MYGAYWVKLDTVLINTVVSCLQTGEAWDPVLVNQFNDNWVEAKKIRYSCLCGLK